MSTPNNNLPERLFMTALLKHTAIALVILVPLALYSSFAAASMNPDTAILLSTTESKAATGSPEAVDKLNVQRYAGTWYEIARFPMYFQRNCASDVTATYTLQQDAQGKVASIDVTNQCRTADKTVITAEGKAVPSGDNASKATTTANATEDKGKVREGQEGSKDSIAGKLKVTFLPKWLRWLPVGRADYWVLAVDEHYQQALVGTPDHKYLWMLSRAPTLNQNTFNQFTTLATQQGYDMSRLQITAHSGIPNTIVSTAQR